MKFFLTGSPITVRGRTPDPLAESQAGFLTLCRLAALHRPSAGLLKTSSFILLLLVGSHI
jgi:hypothetical protein